MLRKTSRRGGWSKFRWIKRSRRKSSWRESRSTGWEICSGRTRRQSCCCLSRSFLCQINRCYRKFIRRVIRCFRMSFVPIYRLWWCCRCGFLDSLSVPSSFGRSFRVSGTPFLLSTSLVSSSMSSPTHCIAFMSHHSFLASISIVSYDFFLIENLA